MSSFPSVSKRDWRRTPGGATTRGRALKRAVLTTCLLALVALFIWLFPWNGHPTLQWAVIGKGQYDTEFRPVPSFSHVIAGFQEFVPAEQLAVKGGDTRQANDLADINPDNQCDVLLVYISAHGVSGVSTGKEAADRPTPYLLESYFNAASSDESEGRLAIVDLLQRVSASRAGLKLLVLDTGHISTDPWLGMLVNEFPRLLEEEVKNFNDPSLWVLTGSGPLERSHFCYAQGQSIFSYYLTQGLAGAADRADDEDRNVDLDELFYFVRDRVADWVDRQTDETQTPQLLKAGKGLQDPQQGLVLLHIPKVEEEEAKAEAEEGAEEKAAAETPKADGSAAANDASGAKKAPAAASPQGNGDGQEAQKNPGPEKPPPADRLEASPKESAPATAQEKAPPAPGDPATPQTDPQAKAAAPDASAAESPKSDPGGPQPPPPAEPTLEPTAESAEEALPGDWGDRAQPDKIRYLLEKAWTGRDALQAREGGHSWSPVDYAPHLWREYQELLLGYEWRWRYGVSLDEEKLAELEDLADIGRLEMHRGRTSILGRLADAQARFLQSGAKTQFDDRPAEQAVVERAVKLKNDLFFAVPYYLRWHAQAAWTSPEVDLLQKPISETIGKLAALARDLESLDPRNATDGGNRSPASGPQEFLQNLAETIDELTELRRRLQEDDLEEEADKQLNEPNERAVAKLETLLATPLLAGTLRVKLLDLFKDLDQGTTDLSQEVGAAAGPSSADREARWAAIERHAELQKAAIHLDDPDFALVDLPSAEQSEENLWKTYREAGAQLKAYYAKLPEKINQALSADDFSGLRRWLPMVDPRDVRNRLNDVPSNDYRFAMIGPIDWIALEGVHLNLESNPAKVVLAEDRPTDFQLTIAISGRPAKAVSISPVFDAGQIRVDDAADSEAKLSLQRNAWRPLSLGTDGKTTLHLSVRPLTGSSRFEPLTFRVKADDTTETCEIPLELARPDVVNLVVQRILDAEDHRMLVENHGAVVKCPVFPNRLTEFVLGLENLSGKERTVTVQFFSAPRPPKRWEDQKRGEPVSDLGRPLDGFAQLTEPLVVPLPATNEITVIKFPSKEKEAADGNQAAEKPAGANGEPPKAGDPADPGRVIHGLACTMRDEQGAPMPTQWIDLEPRAPSTYLDPSLRYIRSRREVTIELQPKRDRLDPTKEDAGVFPAVSEEAPITVVLETVGGLAADMQMINYGAISKPNGKATLKVMDVDLDKTPKIEAQLTVDGYPRAFVFKEFLTNRDRPDGEVNIELERIAVTSPERDPEKAYKIEDGRSDPPLVVEFRVDTPTDAFGEEGDVVGIALGEKQEFHSQRQEVIHLTEPISQGIVKIFTAVGDYRVTLDPGGLVNQRATIQAQLFLGGDLRAEDQVKVVLDGAPPQLSVVTTRRPVPQASELSVAVRANDLSGYPKIEFGYDLNDDKAMGEDEKVKPLRTTGTNEERIFFLPTDPLTPGKTYGLIVLATDRVGWFTKQTNRITIGPPGDSEAEAAMKIERVTVQVQAHLDGDPETANRWSTLTIKGLPGTPQKDRDTGTQTFNAVPPGSYKLSAKGITGNRSREGKLEIDVTADKPVQSFNIPME